MFVRKSMKEEIKIYLSDLIMKGEVKPGNQIVETKIAKELQVSQSPVREAFKELESLGILEVKPFRGTFVKKFSKQELKDIYSIRAELEGLAIESAIFNIEESDIESLKQVYKEMEDASLTDNLVLQIKLDNKFHRIIVELSHSEILLNIWEKLCLPYWTYYGTILYSKQKNLIERHKPIIGALQDKDETKAKTVIREHFLELKNHL
ncbi:GntR family transcriptional regulator [Alteribacillus sp. YIM 98480]|uniref:GntR family transcriptional regulator n=1 Tax=Alteribacillus sp. YIM 98480 TaxID=2606599 RepID=UPI00131D3A3A|nr:GntR family transcriptional regulator [Alteribacillus sp. YIM 98480]